jgi:hypothetical protein
MERQEFAKVMMVNITIYAVAEPTATKAAPTQSLRSH